MDRSGELVGRIDTPSNFFVKEFAGIGSAQSRDMNDEDWAIPAALAMVFLRTSGAKVER
jgi:hypothetical protein